MLSQARHRRFETTMLAKQRRMRHGFTLMELLVIAIIAILAALLLPVCFLESGILLKGVRQNSSCFSLTPGFSRVQALKKQ